MRVGAVTFSNTYHRQNNFNQPIVPPIFTPRQIWVRIMKVVQKYSFYSPEGQNCHLLQHFHLKDFTKTFSVSLPTLATLENRCDMQGVVGRGMKNSSIHLHASFMQRNTFSFFVSWRLVVARMKKKPSLRRSVEVLSWKVANLNFLITICWG